MALTGDLGTGKTCFVRGHDAPGATVTFAAPTALRRDVLPAGGFCSSGNPRMHVGLGGGTRVDAARVGYRVVTLQREGR